MEQRDSFAIFDSLRGPSLKRISPADHTLTVTDGGQDGRTFEAP